MNQTPGSDRKNYSRSEWSALSIQERIRAMNDTLDDVEDHTIQGNHPTEDDEMSQSTMPSYISSTTGGPSLRSLETSKTQPQHLQQQPSSHDSIAGVSDAGSKRASVIDIWRNRDVSSTKSAPLPCQQIPSSPKKFSPKPSPQIVAVSPSAATTNNHGNSVAESPSFAEARQRAGVVAWKKKVPAVDQQHPSTPTSPTKEPAWKSKINRGTPKGAAPTPPPLVSEEPAGLTIVPSWKRNANATPTNTTSHSLQNKLPSAVVTSAPLTTEPADLTIVPSDSTLESAVANNSNAERPRNIRDFWAQRGLNPISTSEDTEPDRHAPPNHTEPPAPVVAETPTKQQPEQKRVSVLDRWKKRANAPSEQEDSKESGHEDDDMEDSRSQVSSLSTKNRMSQLIAMSGGGSKQQHTPRSFQPTPSHSLPSNHPPGRSVVATPDNTDYYDQLQFTFPEEEKSEKVISADRPKQVESQKIPVNEHKPTKYVAESPKRSFGKSWQAQTTPNTPKSTIGGSVASSPATPSVAERMAQLQQSPNFKGVKNIHEPVVVASPSPVRKSNVSLPPSPSIAARMARFQQQKTEDAEEPGLSVPPKLKKTTATSSTPRGSVLDRWPGAAVAQEKTPSSTAESKASSHVESNQSQSNSETNEEKQEVVKTSTPKWRSTTPRGNVANRWLNNGNRNNESMESRDTSPRDNAQDQCFSHVQSRLGDKSTASNEDQRPPVHDDTEQRVAAAVTSLPETNQQEKLARRLAIGMTVDTTHAQHNSDPIEEGGQNVSLEMKSKQDAFVLPNSTPSETRVHEDTMSSVSTGFSIREKWETMIKNNANKSQSTPRGMSPSPVANRWRSHLRKKELESKKFGKDVNHIIDHDDGDASTIASTTQLTVTEEEGPWEEKNEETTKSDHNKWNRSQVGKVKRTDGTSVENRIVDRAPESQSTSSDQRNQWISTQESDEESSKRFSPQPTVTESGSLDPKVNVDQSIPKKTALGNTMAVESVPTQETVEESLTTRSSFGSSSTTSRKISSSTKNLSNRPIRLMEENSDGLSAATFMSLPQPKKKEMKSESSEKTNASPTSKAKGSSQSNLGPLTSFSSRTFRSAKPASPLSAPLRSNKKESIQSSPKPTSEETTVLRSVSSVLSMAPKEPKRESTVRRHLPIPLTPPTPLEKKQNSSNTRTPTQESPSALRYPTLRTPERAEPSSPKRHSRFLERHVLVLSSSLLREQATARQQVSTILQAQRISFTDIDGSIKANKEQRNDLFNLSGLWAVYPQVFLVDGDRTTYWGGYDRLHHCNENGTLLESLMVRSSASAAETTLASRNPHQSSRSTPESLSRIVHTLRMPGPGDAIASPKSIKAKPTKNSSNLSSTSSSPLHSPVRSSTSSAFDSWAKKPNSPRRNENKDTTLSSPLQAPSSPRGQSRLKNIAKRHVSHTSPGSMPEQNGQGGTSRQTFVSKSPSFSPPQKTSPVPPAVEIKTGDKSRKSEFAYGLSAHRAFVSMQLPSASHQMPPVPSQKAPAGSELNGKYDSDRFSKSSHQDDSLPIETRQEPKTDKHSLRGSPLEMKPKSKESPIFESKGKGGGKDVSTSISKLASKRLLAKKRELAASRQQYSNKLSPRIASKTGPFSEQRQPDQHTAKSVVSLQLEEAFSNDETRYTDMEPPTIMTDEPSVSVHMSAFMSTQDEDEIREEEGVVAEGIYANPTLGSDFLDSRISSYNSFAAGNEPQFNSPFSEGGEESTLKSPMTESGTLATPRYEEGIETPLHADGTDGPMYNHTPISVDQGLETHAEEKGRGRFSFSNADVNNQHEIHSTASGASKISLASRAENRLKQRRKKAGKQEQVRPPTHAEQERAERIAKNFLYRNEKGGEFESPQSCQKQGFDELDAIMSQAPTESSAVLERRSLSSRYQTSSRFMGDDLETPQSVVSPQSLAYDDSISEMFSSVLMKDPSGEARPDAPGGSPVKGTMMKRAGSFSSETGIDTASYSSYTTNADMTATTTYSRSTRHLNMGSESVMTPRYDAITEEDDEDGETFHTRASGAPFSIGNVIGFAEDVLSFNGFHQSTKRTGHGQEPFGFFDNKAVKPNGSEDAEYVGNVCNDFMQFGEEDVAIEVEYMEDSIDEDDEGHVGFCSAQHESPAHKTLDNSAFSCGTTKTCGSGLTSFDEVSNKKQRKTKQRKNIKKHM